MSEFEGFDPQPVDESVDEPIVPQDPHKMLADAGLPPLIRASDLLPPEDDPLTEIPVEPPDEQTPPDEATPPFLIHRNKFGPGAHGEYLPDGTPVGIWLDEAHHDLDGESVRLLLVRMGMESVFPGRAAWFGKQRNLALKARKEIAAHPAIESLAEAERRSKAKKAQAQADYLRDALRKGRK